MEKSLYRFILRYSKKQQVYILLITVLSLPFYYVSLDIPKKIVNRALAEGDGARPLEFFGFEFLALDQLSLLIALCAVYLAMVIINGGFKYYINVYKGLLGERMLRRLRYTLYHHVLRFPLPHFRRISSGEIIPMITAEVEPLGGFIGDALALPMHQGGLLLTALVFIFVQDPVMGLASIALYPIQLYVIPKLQRQVNRLGKERVREVRTLSRRIGEAVATTEEIHAQDTTQYELADFAHRLGRIFDIRYAIYRKKFFMKFLNNFMNQLTPFFFFAIGGYLVIRGELSLGALVAVLAAYKDLAPPFRELLTWYQIKDDAQIKYDQVVSQFELPGLKDPALLDADADVDAGPLTGELTARNLTLTEDDVRIVNSVSFATRLDEHVAVVGGAGSGKDELALMLAGLIEPTSGSTSIGGRDLATLPEAVTGRRIAFVGPQPHLFSASLGDNLYYGLKHRPYADVAKDGQARTHARAEAAITGNTTRDIEADWIDYGAAGAETPADLTRTAVRALGIADMIDSVYDLGLRGTIDPVLRPDAAERILSARAALRARLESETITDYVEPFDRERYNTNLTLGENLLFGTPVGDAFDMERLAENAYVVAVLKKCGLIDRVLEMGHEVAQTMVELFSDLPPGHEFFEQFSFIQADDLPEFRDIIGRMERDGIGGLSDQERQRLMSLTFKLIPARHALGIIDGDVRASLLEARHAFARDLPASMAPAVEFFDAGRYNAAASLQDNILFGRLAYGKGQAGARVGALVSEVIDDLGLRETVIEAGLGFQVGVGGGRLSSTQRSKLSIARSVLKRPDMMIVSGAVSALDGATQSRIAANLLDEFKGRGLIWALERPRLAAGFDRVLVMRGGRLIEEGRYDDLDQPDSHLTELIAAE